MLLKLREFRKKNNITQKEIAEWLKITQSAYGKKEREEIPITIQEAEKICKLLKCKYDIFFNNKKS